MKNKHIFKTLQLTLLLILVFVWIIFPVNSGNATVNQDQNDYLAINSGTNGEPTIMTEKIISGVTPTTITLEWAPNPEKSVTGYLLYHGNASGKYLPPTDVGFNTNYTIHKLNMKKQWFFAVKAYDIEGNQSDYSNEVAMNQIVTSRSELMGSGTIQPTQTPQAFDEDFGKEVNKLPNNNPLHESVQALSPAGKIVAGTGPWSDNGGWIKTLTKDYSHDHWSRLGWTHYNYFQGESRVARGDINGDGKDEIVIGMGPATDVPNTPYGYFQVLDNNHRHLFWGQVNWEAYNEINGETWPACGDLDGDGKDEILIGLGRGGMGMIEVFSVNGNQPNHHSWITSTWPEYNQAMGEVRPASGDLNGDGKDDVIVGFGPVADNPEMPGGAYEILSESGEHMDWGGVGWSDYNQLNGESRPVIGDLNGDGINEIIIGLGSSSNGAFEIQSFNDEGILANQAWLKIPWWQEYNELSGETRPAVGNLDGDDADELVIALGQGGGGWIHLFDDKNCGYNHYISLQLWPEEYNLNNGASWVTIKK